VRLPIKPHVGSALLVHVPANGMLRFVFCRFRGLKPLQLPLHSSQITLDRGQHLSSLGGIQGRIALQRSFGWHKNFLSQKNLCCSVCPNSLILEPRGKFESAALLLRAEEPLLPPVAVFQTVVSCLLASLCFSAWFLRTCPRPECWDCRLPSWDDGTVSLRKRIAR